MKLNKYQIAYKKVEDLINIGGAIEDKEETLKALKEIVNKTVPKKVEVWSCGETRYSPSDFQICCPCCDSDVTDLFENSDQIFCPECGQKIYRRSEE